MAFAFLYLAFRALLGVLVRSRRGLDVKDMDSLGLVILIGGTVAGVSRGTGEGPAESTGPAAPLGGARAFTVMGVESPHRELHDRSTVASDVSLPVRDVVALPGDRFAVLRPRDGS